MITRKNFELLLSKTILFIGVYLIPLFQACQVGIADIDKIPDNPTWENAVADIFADHCNQCHGAQPNRGGKVYEDGKRIRFDKYKYAFSLSKEMREVVESGEMPPVWFGADFLGDMGPNARATLLKWAKDGAPEK